MIKISAKLYRSLRGKDNYALNLMDFFFMGVIFVFAFLHVSYGVDLADTSYSLGNYENLSNMGMTWTIATLGANIVGKILTILPGGHTWLGMNIYATLLLVICVEQIYIFLRRYMNGWIIFIGEILALSLCWCPKVILYNYLSYILFSVAIMVLVRGMESDSRLLMGTAGAILAVNIMVRFPNIMETALIVAVWADGFFKRKKFRVVLGDTRACIVGFGMGLVVVCTIIFCLYGINAIPDMLASLYKISSTSTGYSPLQMLQSIFFMYQTTIVSVFYLVSMIIVFSFIFPFLKKSWMRVLLVIAESIAFAFFISWEYKIGFYSFDYYNFSSFQHFAIIFLEISFLVCMATIVTKQSFLEEKFWAVIVIIVIVVTPLGSNNALSPVYNNLFLVAPLVLWMIWKRLFEGKNFLKDNGLIQWAAIRTLTVLIVLMFLAQSVGFGIFYIFGDAGFPYTNSINIKGNKVMIGMHTNAERAQNIEDITEFASKNNLYGQQCIIFGELPGLSYILDMPCAISHTWPDLSSYSIDECKKDFEKLEGEPSPVIFVNNGYYPDIWTNRQNDDKVKILVSYMTDHNYKLVYSMNGIEIYTSQILGE